MKSWYPKRITTEMAVRIGADAVMVNAAFFFALMARYLWSIITGGEAGSAGPAFSDYVEGYARTSWLVTLISLIVCSARDLCTRDRRYRGRYKALIILQAVSVSYLIFGFIMFLLREVIPYPRSVLMLGWCLNVAFVLGVRLWMMLWRALAEAEHRLLPFRPSGAQVNKVLVIGGAGYISARRWWDDCCGHVTTPGSLTSCSMATIPSLSISSTPTFSSSRSISGTWMLWFRAGVIDAKSF